jgi:coiled-coil domain-containing protein 130
MSSLAASKSDNFYYPPGWKPEDGSISKFQGSSGANQYQKYGIIRFELPFDGWCLKCGRHMSKGLRFNAKKDKAGTYYTTTIWQFTMKCYSCDQQIIIRTNPQERTYDFAEGLRKHEQEYDPEKTDGVIELLTAEQKFKIANDPMLKLQHINEGANRTKTALEQLSDMQELQEAVSKKDYDMNSLLRKKNRTAKKKEIQQKEDGLKIGLDIALLDYATDDEQEAKESMRMHRLIEDDNKQLQHMVKVKSNILSQPIFQRLPASSSPSVKSARSHKHVQLKEKKRSLESVNTVPTSSEHKIKKTKVVDLSRLQMQHSSNSSSSLF